ncbi:protein SPIRAL1-like 2 [Fagus crenata]
MGHGVSAGGGQSSLGYLFGSGETTSNAQIAQNQGSKANNNVPSQKTASAVASQPIDKQIPTGVPGHLTNNYFRADG